MAGAGAAARLPEGALASGACGARATETIVGVRPRAGVVSRGFGAPGVEICESIESFGWVRGEVRLALGGGGSGVAHDHRIEYGRDARAAARGVTAARGRRPAGPARRYPRGSVGRRARSFAIGGRGAAVARVRALTGSTSLRRVHSPPSEVVAGGGARSRGSSRAGGIDRERDRARATIVTRGIGRSPAGDRSRPGDRPRARGPRAAEPPGLPEASRASIKQSGDGRGRKAEGDGGRERNAGRT